MADGVGVRILVVDDNDDVQRTVKRVAEAAGYDVVQAWDGAVCLELTSKMSFDLIVLDINMPEMDGRDVLRRLKENPLTAAVPVMVHSGRGSECDRHLVVQLGAAEFVEKPCDARTLVAQIGRLIDRARHRAASATTL